MERRAEMEAEIHALLTAFMGAWNRHDVDGLMGCMTGDCRFYASSQGGVTEGAYIGSEDVRAGYAAIWETFPDAQWEDARHFVAGDRAVSEWRFTATRKDGTKVDVKGCDIFTLSGKKIAIKDSYRKSM
jgi:ketosteroid isomerase-like protein